MLLQAPPEHIDNGIDNEDSTLKNTSFTNE